MKKSKPAGSRMISTAREDLTYARPGSALAAFSGPELSDHNAIWALCRPDETS